MVFQFAYCLLMILHHHLSELLNFLTFGSLTRKLSHGNLFLVAKQ
jgi:hypothetical protein